MPYVRIPFAQMDQPAGAHSEPSCPICSAVSPELKEQAQQHYHLFRYLHMLPVQEFGVPEYHEKITRKMGDAERPNIIYPVGDATFAHIFPDPEDSRNYYIPVEPVIGQNCDALMEMVEDRLVDVVHKLRQPSSPEEQREVLLEALKRVVTAGGHDGEGASAKAAKAQANGSSTLKRPGSNKLKLTEEKAAAVRYLLLRDKVGMGILQPLILDPHIEDISCSGLGPIFVEHKVFKALKSAIIFDEMDDLDGFLRRTSERINKPVTYRRPIVDATLPDGSRVNIVFGNEVSKRGSNFTIRKFGTTPMSVLDIVGGGSLNYRMVAYFSIVIEEGMNLFVSGETASGKTTLLNTLTTFLSSDAKIVTIEDTPELQIPHPNWIREVVRGTSEDGASVSMFDLLRSALRQRPNAILVGEIRGEEGNIAFQAMQAGHMVMATFHAASVEKLIQRITGNPISVPKTYMDNLNVVVIISAVKLNSGKSARRIISVNELFGYDNASDSFAFAEVFHWDSVTDTFEYPGYMNSYLLEQKIAVRRGIPPNQRRTMYAEVERRAKVLEKLHQAGVKDFYELYQVLAKAKRQGLF